MMMHQQFHCAFQQAISERQKRIIHLITCAEL